MVPPAPSENPRRSHAGVALLGAKFEIDLDSCSPVLRFGNGDPGICKGAFAKNQVALAAAVRTGAVGTVLRVIGELGPPNGFIEKDHAAGGTIEGLGKVLEAQFALNQRMIPDLDKISIANATQKVAPSGIIGSLVSQDEDDRKGN